MKFTAVTDGVELGALEPAPAQVVGAIRMIPLLRRHVLGDIRVDPRVIGDRAAGDVRDLGASTPAIGFLPHALIVAWDPAGAPIAAQGAQLGPRHLGARARTAAIHQRLGKRDDRRRLRFLPHHLALEGYLQLHLAGPPIAWSEYSEEALRRGLRSRVDGITQGAAIQGLEDALRVFEIHDDQVGVMIFVADALASATVVPHPADYRLLHRALLTDLFGDLLVHYALHHDHAPDLASEPTTAPTSLPDLEAILAAERASWRAHTELLARGVLAAPLRWQEVYRAGPFRLRRFLGELDPERDNHIGEAILRDDGELEYLATLRLSAAQARRAFLLERLAGHAWSLDRCAEAMAIPRGELIERLCHAGFAYLLRPHVLAAAQRG